MSDATAKKMHVCRVWDCRNKVDADGDDCAECQAPQPPHTCPFASEVRGDDSTLCTCSNGAQYQCAMDV